MGTLVFFLTLGGMLSIFHHWGCLLWVYQYSFYYVEVCSFHTCFLEGFYHKWMLNFVKGFLCLYWDNYMVFIFQFVNVVYHIDWFVNIEESLHPWYKAHLVMMAIWLTFEEDHSRSCVENKMEGLTWSWVTYGKVKVKVTQLCLTLCDSMDYTVHGILQARILEWVAFPFSRGSSQPRGQTQVSHILYQLSHQGSPIILDLLNPGIELESSALQVDSLPTGLSGKPERPFGSY